MAPGEELKKFITGYVDENKLEERLKDEVPRKWEKYGDFVLFDERTFRSQDWKLQGNRFWEKVAEILKCNRLGVKNKIRKDDFRSPNVAILFGSDPWIVHKDNGIIYTWNVEKSMFSAGNAIERHRIAKLDCENEVVVDLFAGIGYFTLPFVIHAKAKFVHACEWNPMACEALRRNLKLNKCLDKCEIHEGDNRVSCPKKIANRVNLGLIPSSEGHWKIACESLVEEGGILHVHENVETLKFETDCKDCIGLCSQINFEKCNTNMALISNENSISWGETVINWKHKQSLLKGVHILHSLISILSNVNRSKSWICTIRHLTHVKSYAPNVHHLVYDVDVRTFEKVV